MKKFVVFVFFLNFLFSQAHAACPASELKNVLRHFDLSGRMSIKFDGSSSSRPYAGRFLRVNTPDQSQFERYLNQISFNSLSTMVTTRDIKDPVNGVTLIGGLAVVENVRTCQPAILLIGSGGIREYPIVRADQKQIVTFDDHKTQVKRFITFTKIGF